MNQPQPNDELLSAYLDNEVTADERARVEQRLATDAGYAATLAAWREQRESLRSLVSSSNKETIDVRARVRAANAAAATAGEHALKEQASPTPLGSNTRHSEGGRANRAPVFAIIGTLAALILVGVFLVIPPNDQTASVAESSPAQDVLTTEEPASFKPSADDSMLVQETADATLEVQGGLQQRFDSEVAAEAELLAPVENEADESALVRSADASVDRLKPSEPALQNARRRRATASMPAPVSAQTQPADGGFGFSMKSQASSALQRQFSGNATGAKATTGAAGVKSENEELPAETSGSGSQFYADKKSSVNRPNSSWLSDPAAAASRDVGQNPQNWFIVSKKNRTPKLTIEQIMAALQNANIAAKRLDDASPKEDDGSPRKAPLVQIVGRATAKQLDQLREFVELKPFDVASRNGKVAEPVVEVGAKEDAAGVAKVLSKNGDAKDQMSDGSAVGWHRFFFIVGGAEPTVPSKR